MHFHMEKVGGKWRWWLIAKNGKEIAKSVSWYPNRSATLRALGGLKNTLHIWQIETWDEENRTWLS